jgi:hypothetical protein
MQTTLEVSTRGPGLYEITREVAGSCRGGATGC